MLSRRRFTSLAGGAVASLAIAGTCRLDAFLSPSGDGRLKSRPKPGVKTTATSRVPLAFGDTRDGFLQMPAVVPDSPLPLFVLLHGASSSAATQAARFNLIPSDAGVAVLAIDSRYQTWDGISGVFGPDVAFIDRALDKVFGLVCVDPARLAIGGFSDGATYGLSLGLVNGDLFPKIAAFSTGFLVPGEAHGKPHVFMSHGLADDILPIEQCGRKVARELRQRGYDVTFREFAGKHEVPPAVATEGFQWLAHK
jgi:phospholipase/carboxylesterase